MNWRQKNRETQKRFLQYCIQFFRQALLFNYDAKDLVYLKVDDPKFKFSGFAQFIGGHNINDLFKALEDALYYVERNGSGKMIFTDLSFELTRLLHKKSSFYIYKNYFFSIDLSGSSYFKESSAFKDFKTSSVISSPFLAYIMFADSLDPKM